MIHCDTVWYGVEHWVAVNFTVCCSVFWRVCFKVSYGFAESQSVVVCGVYCYSVWCSVLWRVWSVCCSELLCIAVCVVVSYSVSRPPVLIKKANPAQNRTQPGLDGPNTSGWYGRLRGLISPLLLLNSDQLWQQSFYVWHLLGKLLPPPDNCELLHSQKRPTTWYWGQIWSFRSPAIDFLYQKIVQSWNSSIPLQKHEKRIEPVGNHERMLCIIHHNGTIFNLFASKASLCPQIMCSNSIEWPYIVKGLLLVPKKASFSNMCIYAAWCTDCIYVSGRLPPYDGILEWVDGVCQRQSATRMEWSSLQLSVTDQLF